MTTACEVWSKNCLTCDEDTLGHTVARLSAAANECHKCEKKFNIFFQLSVAHFSSNFRPKVWILFFVQNGKFLDLVLISSKTNIVQCLCLSYFHRYKYHVCPVLVVMSLFLAASHCYNHLPTLKLTMVVIMPYLSLEFICCPLYVCVMFCIVFEI